MIKTSGDNYSYESCSLFPDEAAERWQRLVENAIADRRIVFVYQAIVTRSGIHDEEALARLVDDDGSLIPAYKWIDAVLSSSRLSMMLDEYVLERQIERLSTQDSRRRRRVWINMTSYSLRRDDLVSRLQELLDRYQVDSRLLCLEVTEQNTLEGIDQTLASIRDDIGCWIALDDFGAGYSNLRALAMITFDAIKIDGLLVREYQNPRCRDIIRLIARLAWKWQVVCVAEWIETSRQFETLWALGLTGMQGFLITDLDDQTQSLSD